MNAVATNILIIANGCFSRASLAGWSLDPAILVPFVLGGGLYWLGLWRLWRHAGAGHGARPWQAACFALGWLTMGAALVSPLHTVSRSLFAWHMVEHELVMAVAAPLLVLSRPLGVLIWAFPRAARPRVARGAQVLGYLFGWEIWTRPLPATLLHAAAIWAWHVPTLFDAALTSEPMHWLQHLSFLVTALFFWWAVLGSRQRAGLAILELFVTGLHTGALGVVLTLAPRPLYAAQAALSAAAGVDTLADQQIAGLIMWVPAGVVYVGAALAVAALWIGQSSRGEARHALRA